VRKYKKKEYYVRLRVPLNYQRAEFRDLN